MKKKRYIIPTATSYVMATALMQVFSGGGTNEGDPQVSNDTDDGDDPNRSRHHNVWNVEEDEWERLNE